MSYSNIPIDLPDPFQHFPAGVIAPLTKVEHISALQVVTGTTTLGGGQTIGPLVYTASADSTVTLPAAQQLLNSYGTQNQIQVGDYLIIQVYNVGAGTVSFASGSGGSGSGTIAPGTLGFVAITFTSTTSGSTAYTFVVG